MTQRAHSVSAIFVLSVVVVVQSAIIQQRDTLHILGHYGQEVSITVDLKFKVDSVSPGQYPYPCSLSYPGIFFSTNGTYPSCPCCPIWIIGSPNPFYQPKTAIELSRPLELNDTSLFWKNDTFKIASSQSCRLPSGRGEFLVFKKTMGLSNSTYLLVHIGSYYLDSLKPTETGGGEMGYPVETCKNMLIVDMYYQTDGSTDFSQAHINWVKNIFAPQKIKVKRAISSTVKLYDIQGHLVRMFDGKKSTDLPKGCYLKKSGNILERIMIVRP